MVFQAMENGGSMTSTEHTLTITTSVLLNEVADSYLLTVGLNQEATTVKECNELINDRIEKTLSSLRKIGVSKEDSYVDFITQTKVYDYTIDNSEAEQLEIGFEIKKNINIYFTDITLMDQIVEICAQEEIYDIINIEYIIEDVSAVYNQLFEEAMSIAESKKEQFEKFCSRSVSDNYRVLSDNFFSVFPKSQYKQYEAKESSQLNVINHNRNQFVRKEARKNRTYYYQGLNVSDFDKVLGIQNPQVGVQHSMTVTVEYKLNP